jgi:hypothetical protein
MASRTDRRPTTLPVKRNATAVVSYIREMPGAVFFGDAINDDEAIEYAIRLQQIRREYENDDCQVALWHDLSQMGFGSREISRVRYQPGCDYELRLRNADPAAVMSPLV